MNPTPKNELLAKTALQARATIEGLIARGYTVNTPLTDIVSSNSVVSYVCKCKEAFTRPLKAITRKDCRSCNSMKLHVVPDASMLDVLQAAVIEAGGLLDGEQFKPIEGGWFSNKGRLINAIGKLMTVDVTKNCFHLAGKTLYVNSLLFENFKMTHLPSAVVAPKPEPVQPPRMTKEELDAAVAALRQKQFAETQDVAAKLKDPSRRSVQLPCLPALQIFDDGTIFSHNTGRYVSTNETYEGPGRKGYLYFTANNVHGLYVHRIVSMAYHPIDGKSTLEDYKTLQVNHKDGNPHNNHPNNLEWVTAAQNIKHSYETQLNRKVRPVLQYKLNEDGTAGELINEYMSVAAAARATNRAEHQVREPCNGKTKQRDFFFKFKFEDENGEWSKKFSSTAPKEAVAAVKAPRLIIQAYHKLPSGERGDFIKTFHSYKDIEAELNVTEGIVRHTCYGHPNRTKYTFVRIQHVDE
jgi:hypothetical protein